MQVFENNESSYNSSDDIDRLREIQEEIGTLMQEANNLVRSASVDAGDEIIYERWKAYPYGNIMSMLVGGSRYDTTFGDIIDEIEKAITGDEDDMY